MDNRWQIVREGSGTLEEVLSAAELDDRPFSKWVSDELTSRGLKKNIVVRRSRLNQTFAYQIIAGTRKATRDKLIQLAFGMQLSIDDASELLERGGTNALSPRCRRDVLIAYALDRSLSVLECDDLLWLAGERTLVTRGTARRI